MIYPSFLTNGSTIGICAPSAGAGKDLESFDACLDTLKQQGYNIKETQHVRVNDPRGGNAKQRGDELNQLFQDPEVDFVMCAKGGDFLNEMIPYISFETLKKHPKFIMGASDPTGVLYPYTTLCDVATIYGFNGGSSYDLQPLPQFVKNNLEIIKGNLIEQTNYPEYQKALPWDVEGFVPDTKVQWNCTQEELTTSGRCIGGCIDVLKDLIGTKFDGTKKFIEKYADAYMYQGIDEHIIDYIKGISGIKDVQYSCFETSRMWTWEGWNIQEAKSVNNNYLYAAEYVEPSYEIYNILIDYAKDCDFSYEDFCNGDAVIVFEEPNIHGGYDSTIGKDTKINLMNYCSFPKGSTSYDSSYGGEYYENLYEYMYNNGMITVNDNYKSFNEDYLTSDITTEELDKRCREIMNIDENIQVSRSVAEGIVGNTILNEYEYDTLFAPAAVTRAANVVYVNDEIKERLKEYIPEYAKYTMVASNKLGQRAVDRQNELLRNLLGMEELPETITLAMKYNQINVKYSLDSVNLSTGNNLQSYLGPAGFSYYVYSDDKDDARREAIVNYILYGVSLAAAVFVYIAVSLVILVTRNTA